MKLYLIALFCKDCLGKTCLYVLDNIIIEEEESKNVSDGIINSRTADLIPYQVQINAIT